MKTVIVIPARYGSTRLPGKPLLDIAGKPLIQWVYERACESALKDGSLIATDDERIRERCAAFGAEAVMTADRRRSGTDRVHAALAGRDADLVINLQGDEPEIRGDMIDALIRAMERERPDMATLCAVIDDPRRLQEPSCGQMRPRPEQLCPLLLTGAPPLPAEARSHPAVQAYRHLRLLPPLPRNFCRPPEGTARRGGITRTTPGAGGRLQDQGQSLVDYKGIGIDTEEDLERARTRLG